MGGVGADGGLRIAHVTFRVGRCWAVCFLFQMHHFLPPCSLVIVVGDVDELLPRPFLRDVHKYIPNLAVVEDMEDGPVD